MWPSEPRLRNTGLHELDRQSQPNRRGCHSRELQDQKFTFCRRFGTANIFSTVFSMHSIGFLLRATEPKWKTALKIPRLYLSTNPRQCIRQMSGSTLQQVEKFKYRGWYLRAAEGGASGDRYKQGFLRCFRDPIRVPRIDNRFPRISKNYHWTPISS